MRGQLSEHKDDRLLVQQERNEIDIIVSSNNVNTVTSTPTSQQVISHAVVTTNKSKSAKKVSV